MQSKEQVILMVENDADDIFFFRKALGELKFQGKLNVVEDVGKARAFLQEAAQWGRHSSHCFPDLIVSDFMFPRETGVQFFQWLQGQPDYAAIPFVLYSGVAAAAMGSALVRAGTQAFVGKSGNFSAVKQGVETMLELMDARTPSLPNGSPSPQPISG